MIKFFIKLLISLAILFSLAFFTDIESLLNNLYAISLDSIVYAMCLILGIRFIMALRWKILLDFYEVNASYHKLLEIIFVSNAVGHLLPSGIGTDIIRTYELARNEGYSEKILASVFLDRIFGLLSMLLVALIASWFAFYSNLLDLYLPLFISLSILFLPFVFIFIQKLLKRDVNLQTKWKLLNKISSFYNRFITALHKTDIPGSGLIILTLLSASVQLVRSLVFMFIFIGLGSEVDIIYYFIFTPIVFIIILIPVSIGGLGVRESALYAFFGPLGLSIATCTVSGLIFHALQLVMIIPGLVIFNLRK